MGMTKATTTKYAGVDISRYQTGVDYNKLCKAKIDGKSVKFAMLRLSYSTSVDSMFMTHYKGCKAAGLYVGCYIYSMAKTVNEAISEARWVLQFIKTNQLEINYPVVFDYEDEALMDLKLGKTAYTAIADAFMSVIKTANFYPMLYTNPDWLVNRLNKELLLSKYDLWLAHWVADGSQKDYGQTMWQYGVSKVDGVKGDVDVNWCYVGYNKLIHTNLKMNEFIPKYTLKASKTNLSKEETDKLNTLLTDNGFTSTVIEQD